jgi:hypothetical protein
MGLPNKGLKLTVPRGPIKQLPASRTFVRRPGSLVRC